MGKNFVTNLFHQVLFYSSVVGKCGVTTLSFKQIEREREDLLKKLRKKLAPSNPLPESVHWPIFYSFLMSCERHGDDNGGGKWWMQIFWWILVSHSNSARNVFSVLAGFLQTEQPHSFWVPTYFSKLLQGKMGRSWCLMSCQTFWVLTLPRTDRFNSSGIFGVYRKGKTSRVGKEKRQKMLVLGSKNNNAPNQIDYMIFYVHSAHPHYRVHSG